MLQFILGKPASGKTYTVLEKIKELSRIGEKSVLIVPEQFTFESERAVLSTLGDKASLDVDVLSFTRLCEEVGRRVGGIAGRVLNECDKVVFMKQALTAVSGELKLWLRYANSVSFAKTMLDTVSEFKINAITPEMLRNAALSINMPTLSLKLGDIALIYETYDALLGERFIDPTDSLAKLYRSLCDYNFFEGKNVFLDSFKGFTGQQYKIIERIISQAKNIYVSFTDNTEINKEYSIYTNIRNSAKHIERIAQIYNIHVEASIVLSDCRYKNKGLFALEALISGRGVSKIPDDSSVNVCRAATPADEAEFAARTIRKLVREQGYRYRDFVIIARDADSYRDSVTAACKKNGISLFSDNRIRLSGFPLAVAGEAAIKAMDFTTESILRFHKTGLGTLDTDELSVIENYTYIWNIDGDMWLKEWDMNPAGLTAEDKDDRGSSAKLAYINDLRQRAVKPLLSFAASFKGDAASMAGALAELFEECNASEKLDKMCGRISDSNSIFLADALIQSYEEYMKILDSIAYCYGGKNIDRAAFAETLSIAVSLADVGVVPQTLDQVTFGSADRIRPSRPKVAFILGADQGVFPQAVQNPGVLNLYERRHLIENGIEVSDNSLYSSIDEEYLVYINLCCPSERLYISYYEQSVSGEKNEPSTFLSGIMAVLSADVLCEPEKKLSPDSAPETAEAAFGEYCRRIRSDPNACESINRSLENTDFAEKIEFTQKSISNAPKSITPAAAAALYGENIRMSASKFEKFNSCRFQFFCKFGLKAEELQPADFNVMQRGTIVHYVLEKIITLHGDGLADLTDTRLDALTDEYVSEYFDSIPGFDSVRNSRTDFLISRITRSLKEVVRHVAAELLQSDFKPVACELKIGSDKPLSFDYDGGTVNLYGSIDRVDTYNGYIRVIDYKTSSKSFKLPDILFGLNLQMLIYLYAVTRASGLQDSAAAGILYQPSKRSTNDSGLAMNGLLQSDEGLYHAMDKTGNGEYIPTLAFNKDGSISKRCTSFIEKQGFTEIFDYIEKLMKKTGNTIASGDISVSPLNGRESSACKYCSFSSVCGIENREIERVPDLKNDEVFERMKEV